MSIEQINEAYEAPSYMTRPEFEEEPEHEP